MSHGRLHALNALLTPVLAAISPVEPVALPLSEAVGYVAARSITADRGLPMQATALRSGFAVAAMETIGATAHEPAILSAAPLLLEAGEALPEGCNAILPADALRMVGGFAEALAVASPGEGVRFAGHDLAAGLSILSAGQRIAPSHVLTLAALGHESISVRAPRVRNEMPDGAVTSWINALIKVAGAIPVRSGPADLAISLTPDEQPGLALTPGEASNLVMRNNVIHLTLPARFDGAIGGAVALALPLLAKLASATLAFERYPMTEHIRCRAGLSSIALLRLQNGAFRPLAVGEITLETLLLTTHVAVLPPDIEGYPASTIIDAMPLVMPIAG